jgi:acyl-CoA synthetase (AMP-forming)/AMP-acid ligase II
MRMSDELRLPETIHTIPDLLAFWKEQTPDAPAFITPGSPAITYERLWNIAITLAEFLARAGVGRNDCIVLCLPEGPALATALLGTMSAAIAVPLDAELTVTELGVTLRGFNATGAIVPPSIPDGTRGCLSRLGMPIFELDTNNTLDTFVLAGQTGRPRCPRALPRPEDIAVVGHTSGTTGTPKRIPRPHERIVESGRRHRDLFGLSRLDRALAVAPLTLSLGRTGLFHGIAAGASLIFPATPNLAGFWAAMEDDRPTWMHASAGFLELLTRYLRGIPTRQPPSSFRFVRVTAGAISPEICQELGLRLGAPILPGYSASETGLVATSLPPPAPSKPGSVGRPIQEIRIVSEDTCQAGPGVPGEIWVRAESSFPRYLDDPEMNASAFTSDGWFRTGDVGYLDQEGFLFLTGRLSELINRGGAKISPIEVDDVLLAHPAVSAAATFAIPDELLGEAIAAAVVLVEGREVSPRELRRWMVCQLAPHKVPRRIWFVDDLPRTASGKVQRGVLTDRFLNEVTREKLR